MPRNRRKQSGFASASCHALRSIICLATAAFLSLFCLTANAQIFERGDVAVSGFAGVVLPEAGLAPGVNPLEKSFIDKSGPALRVYDARRLPVPASGQKVDLPVKLEIAAGRIGQVSGLTFVQRSPHVPGEPETADLYAIATSLFGLQIVGPDLSDAGAPLRLRTGSLSARFMSGQWGDNPDAGPGTIWKIDGLTGEVSLFANVIKDGLPNSGPGLGGLAFDGASGSFYVSDVDTGLIHQLDRDGNLLARFDHGRDGRTAAGFDPVEDDVATADITSPDFSAEDPATWGLTQADRRVSDLTVHSGRLYYAVASGPEIWSVSLEQDGTFGNDARYELTVPGAQTAFISEITFDASGRLYLALRGPRQPAFDYTSFAKSGDTTVVRFLPEAPDDPGTPGPWQLESEAYAIGFFGSHRNASGGVALQYAYTSNGRLNTGACHRTLVAAGDRLRENDELADDLAEGGSTDVAGIQISRTRNIRPDNVPPRASHFVDFDGEHLTPDERGHVGSVAVYQPCPEGGTPSYPPGTGPKPPGGTPPPPPGDTPPPPPGDTPPPPPGDTPPPPPGDTPPPPPDSGTMDSKPCADPARAKPDGTCCPHGSAWDPNTKSCSPSSKLPKCLDPARLKPDGTCCPFGQKWSQASQSCTSLCPLERRKPNSLLCCPKGTKWNDQTKSCKPDNGGGGGKEPNITVEKRSLSNSCRRDAVCDFEITVSNTGDAGYTGPIVLDEKTFPAKASGGAASAPWVCQSVAGGYRCTHPPVSLKPGQSRKLKFSCEPGANWPGDQLTNCVTYNYGASGKTPFGKPDDDAACVSIPICKEGQEGCCPANIKVEKKAAVSVCTREGGCAFDVVVSNTGLGDYSGPIILRDETRPQKAPLEQGSPNSPWTCTELSKGYQCSHPTVQLKAGESRTLQLSFKPGSGWAEPFISNCARFDLAATGKLPFGKATDEESCAQITLALAKKAAPPPSCSNGMVLNAAGRCACPKGSRWNGRTCAGKAGEQQRCKLLPGQIRTKSGACVCPRGQKLRKGACRKPSQKACKYRGQVRTSAGKCVCPRGQKLRKGACRKPSQKTCKYRDQVRTSAGKCVCPRGQKLRKGACRKPSQKACKYRGQVRTSAGKCVCPRGQKLRKGACRKPSQKACKYRGQVRTSAGKCVCPRGQKLRKGACRKSSSKPRPRCKIRGQIPLPNGVCVCLPGFQVVRGRCRVVNRCPPGTTGRPPNCRAIVRPCPPGTTGRPPNCRAFVRPCPPGTVGRPPNCRRVVKRCPRGMVGRPPNCRFIVLRCPRGTIGTPPNCQKLR